MAATREQVNAWLQVLRVRPLGGAGLREYHWSPRVQEWLRHEYRNEHSVPQHAWEDDPLLMAGSYAAAAGGDHDLGRMAWLAGLTETDTETLHRGGDLGERLRTLAALNR